MYPSETIENAVNQISKLPGIGKKTALRLALHILNQDLIFAQDLSEVIKTLKEKTKFCKECNNISDHDICGICSSNHRDKQLICIVEDARDVLAIENTGEFNGIYHVLGGIISPLDGIGPEELNIEKLEERIKKHTIKEAILALKPTMDGDTTSFYIQKRLSTFDIKVSSIARGIPMGGELEYIDEITLARSILKRTSAENL